MNSFVIGTCIINKLSNEDIYLALMKVLQKDNEYTILLDNQGLLIREYSITTDSKEYLSIFLDLLSKVMGKLQTVPIENNRVEVPELLFEISLNSSLKNAVVLKDITSIAYRRSGRKSIKYKSQKIQIFSFLEFKNQLNKEHLFIQKNKIYANDGSSISKIKIKS